MNVAKDKIVSVEYTLNGPDGTQLDTSEGGDPLVYMHGRDNMIPGFEEAMEGRTTGDKFEVDVPQDKAYGERHDTMVQEVALDKFDAAPEVGAAFEAETEGGLVAFTVLEVDGETVTVDGNHPLAGITLSFAIEIVDIRDATPEEQESGFPSGHEDDGSL